MHFEKNNARRWKSCQWRVRKKKYSTGICLVRRIFFSVSLRLTLFSSSSSRPIIFTVWGSDIPSIRASTTKCNNISKFAYCRFVISFEYRWSSKNVAALIYSRSVEEVKTSRSRRANGDYEVIVLVLHYQAMMTTGRVELSWVGPPNLFFSRRNLRFPEGIFGVEEKNTFCQLYTLCLAKDSKRTDWIVKSVEKHDTDQPAKPFDRVEVKKFERERKKGALVSLEIRRS